MFKLTKEDTGQIGAWCPVHEKSTLATFNTKEDALVALNRHYEAILHNEQHVTHYGSVLTWHGGDCFIVETDCPKEMWVTTQIFRIEEIRHCHRCAP